MFAEGSGSGKGKGKSKDGHAGSGSGGTAEGGEGMEVVDENDDFITGGADDLSWLIKRVTFKLHETYPSPNRREWMVGSAVSQRLSWYYLVDTWLRPSISTSSHPSSSPTTLNYASTLTEVDKPPYRVTETGWGEFPLNIRVQFGQETGEKVVVFQHGLRLHHWGPVGGRVGNVGGSGQVGNGSGAGGQGGGGVSMVGSTPAAIGSTSGDLDKEKDTPMDIKANVADVEMTNAGQVDKGKNGADVASTPEGAVGTVSTPQPEATVSLDTPQSTAGGGDPDAEGETDGTPAGETDGRGTRESTRMEVDGTAGDDVEMKDGEGTLVKAEPGETGDDASQTITVSAPMTLNSAATTTTESTSADSATSLFPQVNPLPVHSWQYDQFVFTDPTTTFYQLLLAHPETPLPKRSLRRGQDIGQGAILGLDRGSAGVPLEFTKELEVAERMRLEDARKTLVEETDRWR